MENVLGIDSPSTPDGHHTHKKSERKTTYRAEASQGVKRKRGELSQAPKDIAAREAYKRKRDEKKEIEQRKICIGLDFGTTGSAAAYVSNAHNNKPPETILKWYRGQHEFREKAPSVIAYADDNPQQRGNLWGSFVKPGTVSYSWFKLLLDNGTDPAEYDDPLLQEVVGSQLLALPPGKTAQDLVTDFLRPVGAHILAHLRGILSKKGLNDTPLVWMLTVPATWSQAAKEATREAAEKAGFLDQNGKDELMLVEEPQAACLDVLQTTLSTVSVDQQPFKIGASVLNCDLGGGTLDFITYRISSLEPLRIEEVCVGAGAKCGGTTIDRTFWQWCKDKFGIAFTDVPLKDRVTGSKFMDEFEDHKRKFEGTHSEDQEVDMTVSLRMPKADMDDEEVASRCDPDEWTITITSAEMEAMFEPVLQSAFNLVRNQIEGTKRAKQPDIECLILCGGLSSSEYVKYRFGAFVRDTLGSRMTVVFPERPISAIARGAAIFAREQNLVLHRKARDSLGIIVHRPFDPRVHAEHEKIEVPQKGTRAKNQMEWSIRRGQKIRRSTREKIVCSLNVYDVDLRAKNGIVLQDLYASLEDSPPTRLDASCRLVGRLEMDLGEAAKVRRKELKMETDSRPSTLDFRVTVELAPGSETGIMQVRALATGSRKAVGEVAIQWVADAGAGVVSTGRA